MVRPEAAPTDPRRWSHRPYTGLMIDSLSPESAITYQILEADERVSGRLYTHKLRDTPNDYYVGPSP